MRILIVGGTRFVGRHIADAALARGHQLTVFHRGQTGRDLFRDAEHVFGDRRRGGLAALAGRAFDAIVDSSAYVPTEVERVAAELTVGAAHYTLISTISVYRDPIAPGSDERAPVHELAPPLPDRGDSVEAYGGLKVHCERVARRLFAGRALVVRPGLIVGPHDYTGRFAYWPRRVAAGGELLAAEPRQPIQLIDARDLASWVLDSVERGLAGTFTATGPERPLTMAELLSACRATTGSDARPVWVGDRLLLDEAVTPWTGLPLWLPATDASACQLDISAALAEGLRFRPLTDTIRDTLAWDETRPVEQREPPLSRARERELLAKHAG